MYLLHIIRASALVSLFWLSSAVRSEVFVIAAASNPLQSISSKELQALYMGRRQELEDGSRAQATDLPREHPLRDGFYTLLTGMSAAQVNSHWSRLLFSGKSTPPVTFANQEAMFSYLLRTPHALGYTSSPPLPSSGLKVLLMLKAQPNHIKGHAI